MSAVPADHTPEVIRMQIRAGARAEADYLRGVGTKPDQWDEVGLPLEAVQRPQLIIVPRRQRVLRMTTVLFCASFVVLLALTGFEVMVAQQQMHLDQVERRAELAHERYDSLRRENAILRTTERVRSEAAGRGFVRPKRGDVLRVESATVNEIAIAAGGFGTGIAENDAFARHKYLKRVLAESRGTVVEE
jgi:hypothetical protein